MSTKMSATEALPLAEFARLYPTRLHDRWEEVAALAQQAVQAGGLSDAGIEALAIEHLEPCIDDAHIERNDWQPHARAFAHAIFARADVYAERYRKLREQHWSTSKLFVVAGGKHLVRLGTDCPSLNLLDEAVDALPASSRRDNCG